MSRHGYGHDEEEVGFSFGEKGAGKPGYGFTWVRVNSILHQLFPEQGYVRPGKHIGFVVHNLSLRRVTLI